MKFLKYALLAIAIICISFIGYLYFTKKMWALKALRYTTVDIDDYKIFPKRVIGVSNAPYIIPKSSAYNNQKIPDTLSDFLASIQTKSLLIIKKDSILREQYWDNFTDTTISNPFSVSKSIISLLVGFAIQDSLLSLDDKVTKYLPQFNKDARKDISIRHLITMSSGLNFDEDYHELFSQTTESYYGKNLKKQMLKLRVLPDEPPGKIHRYKGSDPQILQMILQIVTQKTLSDYFYEKLAKPLGFENPSLWMLDKANGVEKAYCCLNASTHDLAKIGLFMQDSGKWQGKPLLSKDYIKQSLTPIHLMDDEGKNTDYYGFLWWLDTHPTIGKYFYARGILGQYIIVIPQKRLVIVRFGNGRGQKVGTKYEEIVKMIDYALSL